MEGQTATPKITVLDLGHRYFVANLENPTTGQEILFINKEVAGQGPEMRTVHDGTTNEALMEVLIDRLQILNQKFPCRENAISIT